MSRNHECPKCPSLIGAVAAMAVLLLAAGPLSAQSAVRSDPTGLQLGVHLNGSAIAYDDAEYVSGSTESGGGLGFVVGYGFNRNLSLFLNADGASMSSDDSNDTYVLAHGDLGLRLTFGDPSRAAMFYVQGAVSARLERYDFLGEDLDLSGAGFTGGVGLLWFFSPNLALDVGLMGTMGEYTTLSLAGESADLDEGIGATSTRFDIGVMWFVGR